MEVTFLNNKTQTFDIKDFSRPDQESYTQSMKIYGTIGSSLYPLNIKDSRYMLDKNGNITHPDVFKAICNGFDIDLS